ncbi:MAG: hypothetical protein WB531_05505 [Thermoplasmata archaeon]
MAVILGLLLVVTFIANYISTTLPSQMGQNDLQHEVTVQNQVAQLAALLQEVAKADAIDAQVSQPVTLGSTSAPPFAGQDSSTISQGNVTGGLSVNFTLAGPSVYAPPTGFPITTASLPSAYCSPTRPTTTLTCSTHAGLLYAWNFSAGDGLAYSVTLGTGSNLVELNFATNGSTISISGISGMPTYIQVVGSNDTLTISNNGGGNGIISVNITGNYDTIASGSFPGGASTIVLHVVGDHDYINGDPASGGNVVYASFIGADDTLALVPGSGSTYYTYFTGFDTLKPTSASCPYGALALTDAVTGYTAANGQSANAHLYQSFNNSTAYPTWGNLTPSSRWTIHYHPVLPTACPFVSQVVLPVPTGGAPRSASLVVHLRNTYAPSAEVALDQGAVVYVQPGAIPVFVVPPPISYANGVLSIFIPRFSGSIGTEAGVGTADVLLRLLSVQQLTIPSYNFTLQNLTKVTITIISSYAAAWYAYFHSVPSLASYVSCAPTGASSPCTALYQPGRSLGTVTLAVPVTSALSLDLLVGLYSVGLA